MRNTGGSQVEPSAEFGTILSNLVQTPGPDILACVNTGKLSALCAALGVLIGGIETSAAEGGKGFGLKPFSDGFVSPTAMVPLPGSQDVIVADQAGVAYVVGKDGKRRDQLFIDVRPRL